MTIRSVAAVTIGALAITASTLPATAGTGPARHQAARSGHAAAAAATPPAPAAALAARRRDALARRIGGEPAAITGMVLGVHAVPLTGACVTATGPASSITTQTRADGRFFISGLRPGVYTLAYRDCAAPARYFEQWSGEAGSPQAAARIPVTAGQVRTMPPTTLRPTDPAALLPARPSWARRPASHAAAGAKTGAISGVVTGRGHPLRGICVSAGPASGDFLFGTLSSRTGHYVVRGLPAGRNIVEFTTGFGCGNNGNWLTQWYKNVNIPFPPVRPTPVIVKAGKTTKGIDGRLKLGGEISGTVTSRSGKKLRGICVTAEGRVAGGFDSIGLRPPRPAGTPSMDCSPARIRSASRSAAATTGTTHRSPGGIRARTGGRPASASAATASSPASTLP